MASVQENAESVAKVLRDAADVSPDDLEDALHKAAEPLVEEMADRAPRSEGPPTYSEHLYRTMNKQTVQKDILRSVIVAVGPSPKGSHGIFSEIGTPHMAPDPWMRPAVDALEDRIFETIEEELTE